MQNYATNCHVTYHVTFLVQDLCLAVGPGLCDWSKFFQPGQTVAVELRHNTQQHVSGLAELIHGFRLLRIILVSALHSVVIVSVDHQIGNIIKIECNYCQIYDVQKQDSPSSTEYCSANGHCQWRYNAEN